MECLRQYRKTTFFANSTNLSRESRKRNRSAVPRNLIRCWLVFIFLHVTQIPQLTYLLCLPYKSLPYVALDLPSRSKKVDSVYPHFSTKNCFNMSFSFNHVSISMGIGTYCHCNTTGPYIIHPQSE